MIKICPAEDIGKWIDEHLPNWRARAAYRTEKDRSKGHYVKRDGIWSDLKPFFVAAQFKKCAYCESYLGANGVDWQIDHYRPKARVISWRPRKPLRFEEKPLRFDDEPSSDQGYYQLAYNADNYVAACGSCNSPKLDYFPVLAKRQLTTTDSGALASEKPLIINPIDAQDEDPEELIEFYGPFPTARCKEATSRLRALATIELLHLEDERRVHNRCAFICLAWTYYRDRDKGGKAGCDARDFLDAAAGRRIAYSNCIRSFLRLCETNQSEAETLADRAHGVVFGVIPPSLPGPFAWP